MVTKSGRPPDVTVVAVILFLKGFSVATLGGLSLSLAANFFDSSAVFLSGVLVAYGLFSMLVGGELWAGKSWAREGGLAVVVMDLTGGAILVTLQSISPLELTYLAVGVLLDLGVVAGLMTREAKSYLGAMKLALSSPG